MFLWVIFMEYNPVCENHSETKLQPANVLAYLCSLHIKIIYIL